MGAARSVRLGADAHALADMVRIDRAQLRPMAGDSEQAQAVKVVARAHQTLIWERTRTVQRLRSTLRESFPATLNAYADLTLTSTDALELLIKAPTPAAGAKARKNYAGTSPIPRASGKSHTVQARYVRNNRLADALQTQAFSALRASPGARRYYDKARPRGLLQPSPAPGRQPPRRHPPRMPQDPTPLRRSDRLVAPCTPPCRLTPNDMGCLPSPSGSPSAVPGPADRRTCGPDSRPAKGVKNDVLVSDEAKRANTAQRVIAAARSLPAADPADPARCRGAAAERVYAVPDARSAMCGQPAPSSADRHGWQRVPDHRGR